ncbi:MAG: DUF3054 domain-containing protein [Actinomycetota bacterium]
MAASTTTRPNRHFVWAAPDVVAVIVFVAVGRRNHDEGVSLGGVAATAAPFLIALVAGWFASRSWRDPYGRSTIAVTWLVTVVGGLALRRTVFAEGIATPFIVVATITLGVLLVVGRTIARRLSRSRS